MTDIEFFYTFNFVIDTKDALANINNKQIIEVFKTPSCGCCNGYVLFLEKRGFIVNRKALENQSVDETINALAMASPFTLEEKQMLLETKNLNYRKEKLEQIINTYLKDNFSNKTIQ